MFLVAVCFPAFAVTVTFPLLFSPFAVKTPFSSIVAREVSLTSHITVLFVAFSGKTSDVK